MIEFLKRFKEWLFLKEKIDLAEVGEVLFNEGEIWWCAIGENIGVEISGKGGGFTRPVYIHRKLSRHGFVGIPLTSQPKIGNWYAGFSYNDEYTIANLSQVRFFSSARLVEKMGELSRHDQKNISKGFSMLYTPLVFLDKKNSRRSRQVHG